MSSPDVSKYVDLTVFDDNPVTVLNSILTSARGLLPNWMPEVGQIEVALAESFATRSSELAGGINRLPSATAEVLLQLFGLTRSSGTKATATLTITFADSDTVARSLPAGTRFLYTDTATSTSYVFVLDLVLTAHCLEQQLLAHKRWDRLIIFQPTQQVCRFLLLRLFSLLLPSA